MGSPGWSAGRIPLISALANSIQTHEVFGTAHSVEFRPFWKILCPGNTVHHAKRLAYGLLLTSCLNDLVYLFKVPSNERLSAVCEECDGVEGFATDCFYYFKRNEAKHFGQITFAKKEEFRGLQAADMMAYEGFKHVTNQAIKSETRPVRKLLQALQQSDRLAVAYAGEKEITRFAESWKGIIDRVVAGGLSAADGGEQ